MDIRDMPIVINIDIALAKKKMRSKELAEAIGITEQNLSILKTGKARALRFTTLEAICKALDCQPGDLLEYRPEESSSTDNASIPTSSSSK
jgi:putative transcriptional regulator